MTITLNGVVFGTSDTDIVLNPAVSGLTVPPIRTSLGNFSGRDGGWLSSQFYSYREIVIRGTVNGESCQDAAEKLCNLQTSIRIRQALPLDIMTAIGVNYHTDVYLTDFNLDIDSKRIHEFQMTLVAPDPNFFITDPDDPESGWIEQTFTKIVGGGYVTPYVLPVAWEPSGQPTVINNPTDSVIYPQIILEGEYTNPRINNVSTGEFIQVNVTTAPGDTIIIDMQNRTITLNGSSILATRTGTWWGLQPGQTLVSLQTDSPDDENEGTIRYRPAYTGIFEGVC